MISTLNSVTPISQQSVGISQLLDYAEKGLKPNECIPFLELFGELIITTQNVDVFNRILTKSKTPTIIASPVEKIDKAVSVPVTVSPHENITERTEKSLTLEKLVMKLLKEGVDPAPNNANKYKKYAVNIASVNLGFSERIRRGNQSVWRVTTAGRKIGCDNYAQAIIFSQRAYEELKNYFLNLK